MKEKTAILVVSFGTSYKETREKTIHRIEGEIQQAYPTVPVYRAWTSKVILRKLEREEHLHFDNVCEAMQHMKEARIRNVVVQPTHVMSGIENDRMKEDVLKFSGQFDRIVFGGPLLAERSDGGKLVNAVMEEFGSLEAQEALVLMGHGSSHPANSVYLTLEEIFKGHQYENVFVGTVEGTPGLEEVIDEVKKGGFRKVHLAPLMLVAGEHAARDMSGEEETSWKSRFEAAGYEVECHLKGLGEYAGVRRLFLEHLQRALESSKNARGVLEDSLLD